MKRLKNFLAEHKWPLIGFMWIVAFTLGYVGFSNYHSTAAEPRSVLDNVYLSLQLFTLESGAVAGSVGLALQVARFLAPAVAIYTALMALATILQEEIKLVRSKFFNNHIVICGLGRKGFLLAKGFREKGERVIVIEQDENNSLLAQCKEKGSIVMIGKAADPSMLRRARVQKAKLILSVCGEDGVNAEVAVKTRELVSNRRGKALSCIAHIVDVQLCSMLREREIKVGKAEAFSLEFFNVFESGARVLLDEYPPFDEDKVSRDDDYAPHIVVVGVGRMGESLVVNAARNWWNTTGRNGKRMRITLVDRNAEAKKESLCQRYPQMESVCELLPIQVDVQSPAFEMGKFLFDEGGMPNIHRIYVCLDGDSLALSAGLALHQAVREYGIPIVVRMNYGAGLATLLKREPDVQDSFGSVHAFGLLDRTSTPDLMFGCTYGILARAMHEEYIRCQEAIGSTPQDNPSMVTWQELPEDLKESNRDWAENIPVMLDLVGCSICITMNWDVQLFTFSPEEEELLAKVEHERFLNERKGAGWIYGDVKDIHRKQHPALKRWEELDDIYRGMTKNMIAGIPSFLARARFQVYRVKVAMDVDVELFERLAKAHHENFRQGLSAEDKEHHPLNKPYSELTEEQKESNRSAVRDIPNKLDTVGYALIPATGEAGSREFSEDEIDLLAQMEHQRWMREKLAQGWRYGETTDRENKVNSSLVPWDSLPEKEREKNRVLIRNIPDILAEAGYTMIQSSRHSK